MNIREFSWKCLRRITWGLSGLFPVKGNKIVISSYYGRGYSDNGRAIVDKLLQGDRPLDIVWLLKDLKSADTLPQGVRGVKLESCRGIYEMASARLWIDNCRKWRYVRKKPNQLYMQTWHGSLGVKKIEADAEEAIGPEYMESARKDTSMTDVMLSNSDFFTGLCRRAFGFEGPVLECGCPRNDIIINGSTALNASIREYFNLPGDAKLCLYAPTFRKDFSLTAYDLDYSRLKVALESKFGGRWVILVRLHPNIFAKSSELNLSGEDIVNASYYDDMQDLLVASDMLITDYSSSMFDYFMSEKPVFVYASDIASYADDRGFYFELNQLPFGLAESNDQLMSLVESFDQEQYKQNIRTWAGSIGLVEKGTASEQVCRWIYDHM
ncbi:MAG: CDP-glycerol glycerophosphotransferase family protein [Clostridia bacterium]|nr:CDP-glycerol glycerophosphotransferase family protein [Clostridia bacterium]